MYPPPFPAPLVTSFDFVVWFKLNKRSIISPGERGLIKEKFSLTNILFSRLLKVLLIGPSSCRFVFISHQSELYTAGAMWSKPPPSHGEVKAVDEFLFTPVSSIIRGKKLKTL